ncbi:DUF6710 family protein [Oceanobacillus longus]|uniref:DUF6710 family protein n=1 Tax=Oceanobacillus longus TaxID=930120 RepID=A0ABV8H493_9BACI
MGGYLSTNIEQLREMIEDVIYKIEYDEESISEKSRKSFDRFHECRCLAHWPCTWENNFQFVNLVYSLFTGIQVIWGHTPIALGVFIYSQELVVFFAYPIHKHYLKGDGNLFFNIKKKKEKKEKNVKQQLKEIHSKMNAKKNKKDFDSIMEFANSVLELTKKLENENGQLSQDVEHPLVDVVRLVGRKIQTEYLTNLLYKKYESELTSLFPEEVLFDLRTSLAEDGKEFEDIITKLKIEKTLSLNHDLVLPWSWRTSRLVNCIAQIGEGRANGPWRQDFNHNVDIWLPMGIAWVYGGNHSISTGILQGKGSITPEAIYDISAVYDYVDCDGVNYYRKEDGFIISQVKNAEIAAIFEIGRLMKESSISY